MKLTEQDITKYQHIYRKLFNKDIPKEEALRQGLKLVLLIKTLISEK
jgi:hypothetical protein